MGAYTLSRCFPSMSAVFTLISGAILCTTSNYLKCARAAGIPIAVPMSTPASVLDGLHMHALFVGQKWRRYFTYSD